jgi:formate hydrogenlyase subunit 6/NADH:ubiquinone oxidoreductase subunit I
MPKAQPVCFEINWNACLRCGACVGVCPQPPGFVTPFDTIAIDKPCDIVCMACDKICPVSAITPYPAGAAA